MSQKETERRTFQSQNHWLLAEFDWQRYWIEWLFWKWLSETLDTRSLVFHLYPAVSMTQRNNPFSLFFRQVLQETRVPCATNYCTIPRETVQSRRIRKKRRVPRKEERTEKRAFSSRRDKLIQLHPENYVTPTTGGFAGGQMDRTGRIGRRFAPETRPTDDTFD